MSLLARFKPSSSPSTLTLHPADPDTDTSDAAPPPPPPPKDPYLLDPSFRVRPAASTATSPITGPGQASFPFAPTPPLNGLPANPRPSTATPDLQRPTSRETASNMPFSVSPFIKSPFSAGSSSTPTSASSTPVANPALSTPSPAQVAGPSSRPHAHSPSSSSFDADETGSTLASIPSSSNSSSYPPGLQALNGGGSQSDMNLAVSLTLNGSGDGHVRPFEKISGGRAGEQSVQFVTPPNRKDSIRQAMKGKARLPADRSKIFTNAIGVVGSMTKRGASALTPVRRATAEGSPVPPPGSVSADASTNFGTQSQSQSQSPPPSAPPPQTAPAGTSSFKKALSPFFHRPHTPSSSSTSAYPSPPLPSAASSGYYNASDVYPPEPGAGDPSISLPFQVSHNIHVDEGFSGLPPSWAAELPNKGFTEVEIQMMRLKGKTGPPEVRLPQGRETPEMGALTGAVVLPDREIGRQELGSGMGSGSASGWGMGMGGMRSGNSTQVSGMGIGIGGTMGSGTSPGRAESAPQNANPSPSPNQNQNKRSVSPLPPSNTNGNGLPNERRVATPPRRPPPAGPLPAPPPKDTPKPIRVLPEPPVRRLPTPPGGFWPADGSSEDGTREEMGDMDFGPAEQVVQEAEAREVEVEMPQPRALQGPELRHTPPSPPQPPSRQSIDTAESSHHAPSSNSHSYAQSHSHEQEHGRPIRASIVPPQPPVLHLPDLPLSLGLGLPANESSWGGNWADDIFAQVTGSATPVGVTPSASVSRAGAAQARPVVKSEQEQKAAAAAGRMPTDERARAARTPPAERMRKELEKEREEEVKELAEMAPWLLAQPPSSTSPSSPPPPAVPAKDPPKVVLEPAAPLPRLMPVPPAASAVLSPTSAQAQLPTIRELHVRHPQQAPPSSPPPSMFETDGGHMSDRSESGFSLGPALLSREQRDERDARAVSPALTEKAPTPLPQVEKDGAQVLTIPASPDLNGAGGASPAIGSAGLKTPQSDDEFDPSAYADMSPREFGTSQTISQTQASPMPSPAIASPVIQLQHQQRAPSPAERPLPAPPLTLPITPPRPSGSASPVSASSALPSSTIFPSHLFASPVTTPQTSSTIANGFPRPSMSPQSDGGYTFTLAPGSSLPSRVNSLQASPGGPSVRFPQTPMIVRDPFPRSPGGDTHIGDDMEDDLEEPPVQEAQKARVGPATNGNATEEPEEDGIGNVLEAWLQGEAGEEGEGEEDTEERRSQNLPEGYRPLAPYILPGSPPAPKALTLIALGTHSHIYTASPSSSSHAQTQHLAFKYLPRPTLSTLRETLLQLSLRHAHLLGADGAWLRPQSQIEGMEAEEAIQEPMMRGWEMWVRMERMERSLAEVCVLSGEGLELGGEAVVARLMADVLEALSYLHSRGVVHRDVRSDNLLFSSDGRLLLADFFHAVQLTEERPMRNEVVGVWYWMAPELRAGTPYNTAVDIYSLGATLWELLEGVPPHSEIEDVEYLRTIRRLPPLSEPQRWSDELRRFLAMCGEEPGRRPSAAALLESPFIRRARPRQDVLALLERARLLEDELHRQEAAATI